MKKRNLGTTALATILALSLVGCAGGAKTTATTAAPADAKTDVTTEAVKEDSSAGNTAPSGDAKYVLRFGHTLTEQDLPHIYMEKWADSVREKTNGAVEIEVYANAQLGTEEDVIEQIRQGANIGWQTDFARLGSYVNDLSVCNAAYFIDNQEYFTCDTPYGDIRYDIEKFVFFDKAVLSMLKQIDFRPDLIHCHDWETGLIPVFLKTLYGDENYYRGIRTVFSIHNLKFQGRWSLPAVMDITGLPEQIFTADKLESYGEANYLKGGIVYADAVTTVSETYAREITTEQGGEGLDGLLRARKNDLYGILNGLDYEEYDPQKDGYIYNHFNEQNFQEGKKLNKARLQKELGLPVKENTMLIGIVSRMTSQKGFDLVAYIMDELLATEDVQLAVLGTGEEQYQDMFRYFTQKYPDKIQASIGYSEERAHRIYASCDAFLMPSLFEPCGLSQLMSLRYGTVPIVRETGGLKDTVEAYNEYEHTGTGFSFANYNAHEMLGTIRYALSVFRDRKQDWNGLIQRGMKQDFSWNRSAGKYEALYEKLTDFE